MKRSSRLLLVASLCGVVGFGVANVNATDIDVTATLTASAAVTVANNANIDFAVFDYSAGHVGVYELGPDGNGTFTSQTNLAATGTNTAGELAITSVSGTVDITCDATAIISDGTRALTLTEVKWDVSTANYGAAANTCAGIGAGSVTIDTAVSNSPTLYVGAQLTIGNDALLSSSGSTPYDTATGTGDPITFRIVYQ
ncbi:MAG: hypothetical protein COA45_08085 [Zetaproteobacteria bacterium]|nr:MAG: hypothetical protein COA45_08085 [Zetaproteobacteria bacterium]